MKEENKFLEKLETLINEYIEYASQEMPDIWFDSRAIAEKKRATREYADDTEGDILKELDNTKEKEKRENLISDLTRVRQEKKIKMQQKIYKEARDFIISNKKELNKEIENKSKELEEIKQYRNEAIKKSIDAYQVMHMVEEKMGEDSKVYLAATEEVQEKLKVKKAFAKKYNTIAQELDIAQKRLVEFEEKYDRFNVSSEEEIYKLSDFIKEQEKPAEEKPAEENPVIGRQAEGLIKRVQARKLAEEPPVQEPPVQEPPVQEPPVQEPPVQEPPAQEPPVQEPPVQEPPVQTPPTPKGTYNEVHKRLEEEVEKIYNDNKENIDKTFKEHSIEELRKGYSIDEIANDLGISLPAAILLRRKILQDHPELAEQNNEKDPNKKEKSNIWEKIKKGMKSAKEFIVNSKVGSAVINFFKNIPGNVKMLTAGKEKSNSVNELVTRMENACKANKNKEFRDSMKPSQKYTEAYERLNSCSTIKELEEARKELLETNPKDRSIIEEAYDSIVLDSDKTFEDEEQLKD